MLERLVDVDRRSGALTAVAAGTIGVIAHRLADRAVVGGARRSHEVGADGARCRAIYPTRGRRSCSAWACCEMLAGQAGCFIEPPSPRRSGSSTRSGSLIPTGAADWATVHRHRGAAGRGPGARGRTRCGGRSSDARGRGGRRGYLASVAPLLAQVLVVTGGDRGREVDRTDRADARDREPTTTSTPRSGGGSPPPPGCSDDGHARGGAGPHRRGARRSRRTRTWLLTRLRDRGRGGPRRPSPRATDAGAATARDRRARPRARQGLRRSWWSGCSRSDARVATGRCRGRASGSVLG